MSILIKSAKIIDADNSLDGKVFDIYIDKGIISNIDKNIDKPAKTIISRENLHVSIGWLDSSVCFGEPGLEEREDLENGIKSAGLSGFTDIVLNSETLPILDSKADISYIKSKTQNSVVSVHPLGALSKKSDSEELADLKEMYDVGCIGFNDFKKAIKNPNLLKTALQYVQHFDGLILSFPIEDSISKNAQVHEGEVSTKYGIKGFPPISEEIAVYRDLKILEYTDGKLLIPTISTTGSVKLIKEAKSKGLKVWCSVSINNLFFNDDKLKDFDTRFKVMPPIRDEKTRKELIKNVNDGSIDLVTCDHCPIDIDNKKTDFENSFFGSTGLESSFGALNSLFDLNKTIKILTSGYDTFSINKPSLSVGSEAKLTLFNPDIKYTFSKSNLISKSKNSSFIDSKLKGKAYGIVSNSKFLIVE
jgi:dihydroorotase